MVNGQINLRDAVKRQVDFETGGKKYKLSEKPAVLIVRYVYDILNVSCSVTDKVITSHRPSLPIPLPLVSLSVHFILI